MIESKEFIRTGTADARIVAVFLVGLVSVNC